MKFRYYQDENAGILVLSAVSLSLFILATGIVLNIARSYETQVRLSQAVDVASLAGALTYSKDNIIMDSKEDAIRYFTANIPDVYASMTTDEVTINTVTKELTVTSVKNVPLYFKNGPAIPVSATATAIADASKVVGTPSQNPPFKEIAMVLDVTTSMAQGGKMAQMRAAAKNFVDVVMQQKTSISIIPFNHSVRFNTTKPEYATWLQAEAYNRFQQGSNLESNVSSREPWYGCIINNLPPADVSDVHYKQSALIPYNAKLGTLDQYFGYTTPISLAFHKGLSIFPKKQYANSYFPTKKEEFNPLLHFVDENGGVIGTGTVDAEGQVKGYKNGFCQLPHIIPLTTDKSILLAHLDTFNDNGYTENVWGEKGTIGSFGMLWGWRSVSPKWRNDWPDVAQGDPKPYDSSLKALVFFTDGLGEMPGALDASGNLYNGYGAYGYTPFNSNLAYSWKMYGINATNLADAGIALDDRLKSVCDNVKKEKNMSIYTIGYEVISANPADAERASAVLEYCASSPQNYFQANDSDALTDAFKDVADTIVGDNILDNEENVPVRLVK
jgi:Flp pilus assembly protein TadG